MKWKIDAGAASPTADLSPEELRRREDRLVNLKEQGIRLTSRFGYRARRQHKREVRRLYREITRQIAEIRHYIANGGAG